MKKYKPKFRGQDFFITILFKDGIIREEKTFALNRKRAILSTKKLFNGKNGLKKIIKIKNGSKWFR